MSRALVKLTAVCLPAFLMTGCVERKLTITSEPAGALVYVSSEEIGRTPVTIPFTWYGDYDVILRMEGYKTLKTHLNITPPLYEVPPLDLFSELAPWTYRVQKSAHYTLAEKKKIDEAELYRRAEELRLRNEASEN